MIKQKKKVAIENLEQLTTIAELIVEDYRFRRAYLLTLEKVFAEEKKKYESAYAFHTNKIAELTKKLGLSVKTFDGWDYDEGLPITPLNADEFDTVADLKIYQTIEPTVLTSEGNIVKQGTVILSKKQDMNK